jgi:DNA-binding LacI/PurR family transcriptional regulator
LPVHPNEWNMATSIKDIARAAGVSHTTVSRALRDSPEISAATKERIRKLAQEMGYRPSAIARSLVTQRTHTVGVVVTSLADPFHTEVVQGIEMHAQDHGYSILLSMSHEDPARERAAVEILAEKRVDGIIVAASRIGSNYLPLLQRLQVPIVLLNSHQTGEYVYSIATDNVQAGHLAASYLLDLGHRRIGYIGSNRGGQTDRDRLAGFRRALCQAGIGIQDAWIVRGDGRMAGGCEAMREILAMPDQPTALFCYNDLTAIGALKAIVEAGRRVPDDYSLIGLDGLVEATYVNPSLTTVEQPRLEMGRLAMQMLIDVLTGQHIPTSRVLTGSLIERGSCQVWSSNEQPAPILAEQEVMLYDA